MPVIWLPKPGPLFVDMLSITLAVPKNKHQTVVKNFIHDLPEFMGGKLHSNKHYHLNRKLYHEGKGQILLQCQPKFINGNFFRVEWNPSNEVTEQVADMVNLIVPGGYADLIHYGRITRIDIATDIKYLRMWELLANYAGMKINYNYLKAGRLESAYLGKGGSVNQFRFYDKKREVQKTNESKPKQYKEPTPKYTTTRLEWEYRPKGICTFANINETCKPIFNKLKCGIIANPTLPLKTDFDSMVNTVIRLSRYEGLQNALYGIVKHRRAEVRDSIESSANTSWWDPVALWQTFPNAIEPIVYPAPNKWAVMK